MEVILIDETRVLLTLTKEEVHARGLDTEGQGEGHLQATLDRLLLDAGAIGGIELRTGKRVIELFLDPTGGCEVFVTREDERGGPADMERSKEKEREKLPPQRILYSLERLEDLLTISSLLHKKGYAAPAELWYRREDGIWFLLLERERSEAGIDTLAFVEEYANRHPQKEQIFFTENASLILREQTIQRLAALDAKQ